MTPSTATAPFTPMKATPMFTHKKFLAGSHTTSDLADLIGDDVRSCDDQMRNYGGRTRFAGTIRTLRSPDDNVLLKDVLSEPGENQVLVVDGEGSTHTALIGDVIAAIGARNGWAGVIINGSVRDQHLLGQVTIGVKAIGSNPRRSGKAGSGEADVPVTFGGVTFTPGETVYSDEDGIIVVPSPIEG